MVKNGQKWSKMVKNGQKGEVFAKSSTHLVEHATEHAVAGSDGASVVAVDVTDQLDMLRKVEFGGSTSEKGLE